MPKLTNARAETICCRLESGEPAWRIANRYDLPTSLVYFIYHKHRGVNWSEARENFKEHDVSTSNN